MGLFASMALMASVWCWGRPEHTSHTNTETQKVHAAPWNKKPARHHTLTHPLFSGKNFECERSVAGCTLNLATKLKIKKKGQKTAAYPSTNRQHGKQKTREKMPHKLTQIASMLSFVIIATLPVPIRFKSATQHRSSHSRQTRTQTAPQSPRSLSRSAITLNKKKTHFRTFSVFPRPLVLPSKAHVALRRKEEKPRATIAAFGWCQYTGTAAAARREWPRRLFLLRFLLVRGFWRDAFMPSLLCW